MGRITTKDIANACGISRGTVDRALNNKPRVSEATRALVLRTARALNYRPDHAARSLVTGKSMCIGVVVFDIRNRYFAQLVNAIEIRAKAAGFYINIMLQENDPVMERRQIESLAGRRADGLILCPVGHGRDFGSYLRQLSIPVVTIGNYVGPGVPYIGIDERDAAAEAVRVIRSRGYERIIFVCPSLEDAPRENIFTHKRRLAGFLKAAAQDSDIQTAVIDHREYDAEAYDLVAKSRLRTALFCSGDIYALATMKYFRVRGLRVPRDVGLMGFDGVDTLDYVTPSIATVRVPLESMGTTAAEYILSAVNGEAGKSKQILPYEIVEGDSL